MTKLIFITGGVVSSVGKGIVSSSLASLLKLSNYKVRIRKLDPYLNIDPGTMNPSQHGEVFVTDDGAETDMDLGHYERFTGIISKKSDNITSGKVVDGSLNPSSDTETHRVLYKQWDNVKGIAHGHPTYGTSWAQTGKPIPILGTTHADYFDRHVPITNRMKKKDIKNKYEYNTGLEILKTFKNQKLKPNRCPGILIRYHGVFAWGGSSYESVKNLELIELIGLLAFNSMKIGLKDKIDTNLIRKHYDRKHGANFYYGQKK